MPWHRSGATAIQAPDGAAGVAAALAAAALVTWLALAALPPRPVVRHPGPALLGLAAAALVLSVLRLALDAHHLAVGSWLSIVLGALLCADVVSAGRAPRPSASRARAG